jgi:hypothetical protein
VDKEEKYDKAVCSVRSGHEGGSIFSWRLKALGETGGRNLPMR